jgi:hypothetical protein
MLAKAARSLARESLDPMTDVKRIVAEYSLRVRRSPALRINDATSGEEITD